MKEVNHIIFTFHYLNWLVLNPVCLFNMENYAQKAYECLSIRRAVYNIVSSRGIHSQFPHTTGYPYVYPGSPPNKVAGLASLGGSMDGLDSLSCRLVDLDFLGNGLFHLLIKGIY